MGRWALEQRRQHQSRQRGQDRKRDGVTLASEPLEEVTPVHAYPRATDSQSRAQSTG